MKSTTGALPATGSMPNLRKQAPSSSLTTSTVYSTNIYTITSCAPGVTNCPASMGKVTTETVAVSTTVCPVTEASPAGPSSSSIMAANLSTTAVTLSQSFSDSVVVVTSTISFADTPPASNPPTAYAKGGSSAAPAHQNSSTVPGTTLTLGQHYTTVIAYKSITEQQQKQQPSSAPPASAYPHSADVPSYHMSEAASTYAMSGSSSVAAAASSAPASSYAER